MHERVVEYINGNFFALRISRFLNPKPPKHSSDRDKGSLLSQALTATNASTPPKSHISSFIRERSGVRTVFKVTFWVESVWVWEFLFAVMDGPSIPLNPSPFRNMPPLKFFSLLLNLGSLVLPCIHRLGSVRVVGLQ